MKLPHISIIVVGFNNEKLLPECLSAILSQDYSKELLEYLFVDSGSTDQSRAIALAHNFRVIESSIKKDAEAKRAIGLASATHEILAYIDTDNILPTRTWLKEMVEPFIQNAEIICSQTLRYSYKKTDTIFNRYCALFGVSDPVVFYIGRPDRLSYLESKPKFGDSIVDRGHYYEVIFSEKNLPTVGCNGVLLKKSLLLKFAQVEPDKFLHIDIFVDLLRAGFNKFAIVKNDIRHLTAISLSNLIKKRITFLKYYFNQKTPRRYKIYDSNNFKSNLNLALYIFFTLTLIRPLYDSTRGFLKKSDPAWFVHPLVCFLYLVSYGLATIKSKFNF